MADRSNLPAPYQSPWRQLGQALQAVAASLRLDLRALWRRNGAGELPRPGVCPKALAPLFWPLLLGLLLGLPLAAATLLQRGQAPPAPEAEIASRPIEQPPAAEDLPSVTTAGESESDAKPPPPESHRAATATATTTTASKAATAAPPLDPLLPLLTQGLEPDLIAALQANPAHSELRLQLGANFAELAPQRQQQLAATWLKRSLEHGYESLTLIDAQNQMVGYRARVGSGMILLDPAATS